MTRVVHITQNNTRPVGSKVTSITEKNEDYITSVNNNVIGRDICFFIKCVTSVSFLTVSIQSYSCKICEHTDKVIAWQTMQSRFVKLTIWKMSIMSQSWFDNSLDGMLNPFSSMKETLDLKLVIFNEPITAKVCWMFDSETFNLSSPTFAHLNMWVYIYI